MIRIGSERFWGDGIAYILYITDGGHPCTCEGVFMVDTETAECLGEIPFTCNDQGFNLFGMGFSTDAEGSEEETLFVGSTQNDNMADRLGTLGVGTGAIQVINDLPATGYEFTGNALAELWGFAASAEPRTVQQIDKTTAQAVTTYSLDNLLGDGVTADSMAWAWAFWGGDFYIFLMTTLDSESKVYRVFGETGSGPEGDYETFMDSTDGMTIVGAGVSTKAPVYPPV